MTPKNTPTPEETAADEAATDAEAPRPSVTLCFHGSLWDVCESEVCQRFATDFLIKRPAQGKIGDVVLYHPPPHQLRYVAGPWAAIILGFDAQGRAILAAMPPSPAPIGTDPTVRISEVAFSETGEPGCWGWRG